MNVIPRTGSESAARYPGVDALRIIGAVLVVGLHVGLFPEWPVWLMESSRFTGRWVVPFFFVVMGYFIGMRPPLAGPALTTASRVLQIVVICTVLYGALVMAQLGLRQGLQRIVSPETFVRGVWLHLWFLHAALGALLLAAARPDWLASRLAWPLLLCVLMLCSAMDSMFALKRLDWPTMFASRFIAGMCMVWLGIKLAGTHPETLARRWPLLLVSGIVLMAAQAVLVHWRGGEPAELQIPVGAIVLGVAALAGGLALKPSPTVDRLADWGRRHALGLYLLHPLGIEALRAAGVRRSDALWLLAVVLALAAMFALERWFPAAKSRLDGR